MRRVELLRQLSRGLGRRELIWFGTRGDDIHSALDIPNLVRSFSVINTYTDSASVDGTSLERHSGVRVDLDAHDIDADQGTQPYSRLRGELLDALSIPSAVFAYRPSTLLSEACFTRPQALHLGMFKDHQSAFEYKPWVESEVAAIGVPSLRWTYLAATDLRLLEQLIDRGPIVVRRRRSSGGAGVAKVADQAELHASLAELAEGFVCVSTYVPDAVPVNIGAVAWRDGVTVHLPSVQIIGHPQLTARPFGYCGNDFGRMRDLEPEIIDQLEASTRAIGDWLRRAGYRGAFGADFLVAAGQPLFLEVNPRFQGSTHLAASLAARQGESCLLTEHLAAFLGLSAPDERPLRERVASVDPAAHLVQHWLSAGASALDVAAVTREVAAAAGFQHADVLLPPHTACWSGATIARYTLRRTVTTTGFDLDLDLEGLLRQPEESSRFATVNEGR